MVQTDPLVARQRGDEAKAKERFAESTRSTSFGLNLGIREIRMLQDNDFRMMYSRMPAELATLQRLIDKGLVTHEEGQNPKLSEAGCLVRELLVLSKHIMPCEHPGKLPADDVLDIILHGMQWYRDGCGWLDGARLKRGPRAAEDELRITTCKPDYDAVVPAGAELMRPKIKQEFRIKREDIEEIT